MKFIRIIREILSWVKFFIKSKSYYNYDYEYLLLIEREKLKRMAHYFEFYGYTEDSKFHASRIKLAIRMLDTILLDSYSNSLNTKNLYRFVRKNELSWFSSLLEYSDTKSCAIEHFKKCKTLYMYNKLKTVYLLDWWD